MRLIFLLFELETTIVFSLSYIYTNKLEWLVKVVTKEQK